MGAVDFRNMFAVIIHFQKVSSTSRTLRVYDTILAKSWHAKFLISAHNKDLLSDLHQLLTILIQVFSPAHLLWLLFTRFYSHSSELN